MESGKKSGSMKQANKKEQCTEVIYRIKGSSINIRKFPTLRLWNGSNDHVEIYPERSDETESTCTDSDRNPDVIDITLSSPYSASRPDDTFYEGEDRLFSAAKSDSASSLPSTSPPRPSDDPCEWEFCHAGNPLPSPEFSPDVKPESEKHDEVCVFSRSGSDMSEPPRTSNLSAVSDFADGSLMPIRSLPTQSPPTQVMNRSSGYASFTSNDSLFSLQIGNASFAGEIPEIHNLCMSEEVQKSGELPPQPPSAKTENLPSIPIAEIENGPKEPEKSEAIPAPEITSEIPVKSPPVNEKKGKNSGSLPSKSSMKSEKLDKIKEKGSCLPATKNFCGTSCCSWSFCSCSFSWPKCSCWKSCSLPSCKWPWPSLCKCSWPSCSCCSSCSKNLCHCWS